MVAAMSDNPRVRELATLVFDDDLDQGLVRFADGYANLSRIERLDFVRDWVILLTDEYRKAYLEDHPDKRLDDNPMIVAEFLLSAIVPR